MGQLVGLLYRHELQCGVHEPKPKSRWDPLSVSEHHEVREQPAERCRVLEPDAHTQQVADLQQW